MKGYTLEKENFFTYLDQCISYISVHPNEILFIISAVVAFISILSLLRVSIKFVDVGESNVFASLFIAVISGFFTYYFYKNIEAPPAKENTDNLNLAQPQALMGEATSSETEQEPKKQKEEIKIEPSDLGNLEGPNLLHISSWERNWRDKFFKYNELLKVPTPKGQIILKAPKLGVDEKFYDEKFIYHTVGYVSTNEGRFYVAKHSWDKINKGEIKLPTWIYVKP